MKGNLAGTLGALAVVALVAFQSPPAAPAAEQQPSSGWTLHADLLIHFPSNPSLVAHHWCKGNLAGGLTQCQIYASDAANAPIVAIELVVPTAVWKTFPKREQALWHSNKTELVKAKPKLPDLPAEEAAKVVKSFAETYGKLYILWDPGRQSKPFGRPSIFLPH